MTDQSTEPDVAALQQTAHRARAQLMRSIARLDHRVKNMAGTAADATAASGWGIAAVCAWWLSLAVDRPPKPEAVAHRRPRKAGAAVLITAAKAAGFVLTGVLLYSSYKRARRIAGPTQTPPKLLAQLTDVPTRDAVTQTAPRLEA